MESRTLRATGEPVTKPLDEHSLALDGQAKSAPLYRVFRSPLGMPATHSLADRRVWQLAAP